MADDLVVPDPPVLVTVPGVELIHTGTWEISTGTWTVTPADLYAAVAALDCPSVRRPVLKLGHVDPRFDGEPAIGWVDNLAVSATGYELVGDYRGLPAWLADILPSAYPDRSIEGRYDYVCQIGHMHPFVLEAVALLGVVGPGVGTLTSLQDLAARFGVAAADHPPSTGTGTPVALTTKGNRMPPTNTATVAASATVEEVRRSFYDGPGSGNWWWIEAIYVDPLEAIAIDDDTGLLWRVPFSVDADNTITWSEPQQVRREYVAASNTVRQPLVTWASRTESRPDAPRASTPTIQEVPAMPETLIDQVRQRLGLAADATDEQVMQTLDQSLQTGADPATPDAPPSPEPVNVTPAPVGDGGDVVQVDAAQWRHLHSMAAAGQQALSRQQQEDRERLVSAAISDGRIPPSRRDDWLRLLTVDPQAATTLASLAPGLVPVAEVGHAQGGADTATSEDLAWFPNMPAGPLGVGPSKES